MDELVIKGLEALKSITTSYGITWELTFLRSKIWRIRCMGRIFRHPDLADLITEVVLYVVNAEKIVIEPKNTPTKQDYYPEFPPLKPAAIQKQVK